MIADIWACHAIGGQYYFFFKATTTCTITLRVSVPPVGGMREGVENDIIILQWMGIISNASGLACLTS